eukprot:s8690_g3.t1
MSSGITRADPARDQCPPVPGGSGPGWQCLLHREFAPFSFDLLPKMASLRHLESELGTSWPSSSWTSSRLRILR